MTKQGFSDLSPEAWAMLRQLLDQALERPPAERRAWVESLGEPHLAVKPRLRALLAHAEDSHEQLLRTLPKIETADFAAPTPPEGDAAQEAGQHVGPYRLLRQIGEGGMASVWLAERSDLLQGRQVALKLPHGTWRRAAWAARMAREREILATLEHPNIARLYDAGVAADGQPYLALEHVEGHRIDVHCREHGLDVRQRLQLFLQVAHAVAHAHAQLVVHRDLKPSNILVTTGGEVRLLDFGIAKLLDQGLAQETALTLETGRALTPDYAAPEQIRGEAIGTAADVYSLGVVLFELLVGERPYKLKRDSRAALEEAILHAEPPRPSDAVAEPRLRKQLRGDLDTIVLKALKKLPCERYATVSSLAEDIERWLAHRPVMAQADSARYRAAKFIARNKITVGAAAAVVLAVMAGAGVAIWQRQEALAEKRRAEEVKAFIASIFEDANPWIGPRTRPSATDLLERAQQRLGERFKEEPLVRMELLNTLAESYLGLQELDAAESLVRRALSESATTLDPEHPQRIRARFLLTSVMASRNKAEDVKQELDSLLPVLERHADAFAEEFAQSLLHLVDVANDKGDYVEMERLARRAVRFADERLGPEHPVRMVALRSVGNAHENQRQLEPALAFASQAYSLAQRIYRDRPDHPELNDTRFIYARILHASGQSEEAVTLMQQSIDGASRMFGPESSRVGTMVRTLTAPLVALQRLPEALEASERGLRIVGRHFPADSVHYAYGLVARGSIHAALRNGQKAFDDHHRAWSILRAVNGDDQQYVLHVRMNRAIALTWSGRAREAEQELRHVLDRHRQLDLPGAGSVLRALAVAQRLSGSHAAALATLEQARPHAKQPAELLRLHQEIGLNRLALKQHAEALDELRQAQALAGSKPLPLTPERADLQLGLGRALLALGSAREALPHLVAADRYWRERGGTGPWATEAARALTRGRAALTQP